MREYRDRKWNRWRASARAHGLYTSSMDRRSTVFGDLRTPFLPFLEHSTLRQSRASSPSARRLSSPVLVCPRVLPRKREEHRENIRARQSFDSTSLATPQIPSCVYEPARLCSSLGMTRSSFSSEHRWAEHNPNFAAIIE